MKKLSKKWFKTLKNGLLTLKMSEIEQITSKY